MKRDDSPLNPPVEFDFDDFDDLVSAEPQSADADAVLEPDVVQPVVRDERTAEERTRDLLARMAPHRATLLGILALCVEPQLNSQVNAYVDELREGDFSVFSGASLCSHLEKAGALERVADEGAEAPAEPRTVVVDGVEYLETQKAPDILWVTTPVGADVLAADDPMRRMHELFAAEERYLPIFKRILELCATEEGATVPALGEAVDDDPLVQEPRFYASYFIDQLDKCGAIRWQKTWHLTETGRAGLALLSETD